MSLSRQYAFIVAILLLGYAFLDRGFAYIGVAPIYVGEIVLAIGVPIFVFGGVSSAIFRSPITIVLLIFVAWSGITAYPNFGRYGLLTLRDSVIWSYSAYAILVAGILARAGYVDRAIDWYGRWLPWFLFWVPVGFVVARLYLNSLPVIPGSDVPLLSLKGGDFAVHIAGAASFLALGLHRHFGKNRKPYVRLQEFLLWGAWSAGFFVTGSQNRGGLLSVLVAIAVTMVFRPTNRIQKLVVAGVVFLAVFTALDIKIPTTGRREISPQQVLENVQSIFLPGSSKVTLNETAEWRKLWWRSIIDYTLFGRYFWFGKGYGINLADSDGFHTGDRTTRSPHNGHLTILARSGVPGLVFWLALQGTIFIVLIRAHFRARRQGNTLLADINLWVLAYWLAFLANASFDVFLEGPQGGIWFWCLVGFIIALTESQRAQRSSSAAAPSRTAGQEV